MRLNTFVLCECVIEGTDTAMLVRSFVHTDINMCAHTCPYAQYSCAHGGHVNEMEQRGAVLQLQVQYINLRRTFLERGRLPDAK